MKACAKWVWATSRFRKKCAGSAKLFTAARRLTGLRWTRSDERPLAAVLQRNVFAGAPEGAAASRLAAYIREAARALALQEDFAGLRLAFPDPERVCCGGDGQGQPR